MKKILFTALVLLVSVSAFAQPDWGVKGGMTISNVTDQSTDYKPSIFLGVFAEFGINSFFAIQPELIYSRQGSFKKYNDNKMWERLNYINIPVLAKLYLLENFSLELGPQLGFMLNSKYKVKAGSTTLKEDGEGNNTFDFSFAMGLGYKITSFLDVSARYNIGLTEVMSDYKGKNSVFQIGAGYRF